MRGEENSLLLHLLSHIVEKPSNVLRLFSRGEEKMNGDNPIRCFY
jgi:hypothetical protein